MALDFSQYLSKTLDDVEAPKPLPVGHYYATIKSWKGAEADYKQGAGKQPIIILLFSITGATDDIDTDLLPEGGGAGRLVTRDYELADADNRGLYALKRLAAETLNIDIKGLDLESILGTLPGQDVKLYIEQRINPKDPEAPPFPQVRKVLSVDA